MYNYQHIYLNTSKEKAVPVDTTGATTINIPTSRALDYRNGLTPPRVQNTNPSFDWVNTSGMYYSPHQRNYSSTGRYNWC
ncbi:hypothetical protein J6590_077279 [Homalodisca vitripennis]|nr:hypothetical protein J6590_077279 [Homalodisca vitripennis]